MPRLQRRCSCRRIAREALISHAGSATPFMDEWDGDWAGLIKPYLDGALTLEGLAAPFMEHRILFARVMVLSIFHVSGYGIGAANDGQRNPQFHLHRPHRLCSRRVLSGGWALAAIATTSLVNVIPFSFDNVLLGSTRISTCCRRFPARPLADRRPPRLGAEMGGGAHLRRELVFLPGVGRLRLAAALACHLAQMACGEEGDFENGWGQPRGRRLAVLIGFIRTSRSPTPCGPSPAPGEFFRRWLASPDGRQGRCWACCFLCPRPCSACAWSPTGRCERSTLVQFRSSRLGLCANRHDRWGGGRPAAKPLPGSADARAGGPSFGQRPVESLFRRKPKARSAARRRAGCSRHGLRSWPFAATAERPIPKEVEAWRQTVRLEAGMFRDLFKTGDVPRFQAPPVLNNSLSGSKAR